MNSTHNLVPGDRVIFNRYDEETSLATVAMVGHPVHMGPWRVTIYTDDGEVFPEVHPWRLRPTARYFVRLTGDEACLIDRHGIGDIPLFSSHNINQMRDDCAALNRAWTQQLLRAA